ncbi:hypothetical protein EJ08DRAFT_694370 [Tothia fuscella]|uniref:Uncharacterized protein n=1 Tax=Tothia fuscella TaxID=1048955 RepID=A0A9P4NXD9_9PEZI|nr:hypothetical protein EJ08DRAFT_694370 [Tothia fuscella]
MPGIPKGAPQTEINDPPNTPFKAIFGFFLVVALDIFVLLFGTLWAGENRPLQGQRIFLYTFLLPIVTFVHEFGNLILLLNGWSIVYVTLIMHFIFSFLWIAQLIVWGLCDLNISPSERTVFQWCPRPSADLVSGNAKFIIGVLIAATHMWIFGYNMCEVLECQGCLKWPQVRKRLIRMEDGMAQPPAVESIAA